MALPGGLTALRSRFGPQETVERLLAGIAARGMAVLARIDHAGDAAKVGMALRPTELVLFGKAQAGTPLMQADQRIGIDLPLKALVWQDAAEVTWLGYNQPAWIGGRHDMAAETHPALAAMTALLAALAAEATGAATGDDP